MSGPLHVKLLVPEEIRAQLARDPRLLIPVGTCEQHGPHLPLGCDTLIVERLIILTAHGHDPHQEALSTLRTSRARVFTVDVFALDLSDQLLDPETPMHGGELDTSLLLYLAPGLARMDMAQDFLPPGHAARHIRGLTKPLPAISPGSLGRPTLATAEKGERIYKIIRERVASRVLEPAPAPAPAPAQATR